jgi:hypothetical protein
MSAVSTSSIDPKKTYSVSEFSQITGISRQKISQMRRNGLVIRDLAGVPVINGKDFLAFAEESEPYQPKLRGRHKKS